MSKLLQVGVEPLDVIQEQGRRGSHGHGSCFRGRSVVLDKVLMSPAVDANQSVRANAAAQGHRETSSPAAQRVEKGLAVAVIALDQGPRLLVAQGARLERHRSNESEEVSGEIYTRGLRDIRRENLVSLPQ